MTLVALFAMTAGAWAQDPVAKDIVVSPESGTNISNAINDALGTNGDWAQNITINLAKGGTYTITESIVPSASITINGNGATIDAKDFTDQFIKMSKTPGYDKVESGQYVVTTPSKIEDVTITGLTNALFYDNGTPYVFKDFTFNNCLINYSAQGSAIIRFSASMVINFTITNSTFYCLDKPTCTANCIEMSGKRPWQITGFEDSEGKLLVDHNTFYNVAYKKQFFSSNTLKGQTKYKYEFNSNIFVNVSYKKIYGNMTNNKNQLTTDGLNTYIWDGEFFSESNYNGDEGLKSDPSFKDAENGDFTLDRSSLQYQNSTGDPRFSGTRINFNEEKTEASFNMLAFDATADYELVRDMAISMPVTVGDGNDGYRIRLKKSEQNPGKFEPADTDVAGMIAMIKVHDAIENQDLIFFNLGGSVDCTVSIYAIDDNDQPVGNPVAFQDLVPGRYIAKATAATGSTYDGETALSNIFVLFQGYPVEVPAGEFATFYKDEPLYADPISSADAELYTISSVNDTQAVLSSAIETAPSKTPLLVYNNSDEAKTFLLIPADAEPNLSLDVYDGFIGTLTATTIAASDEDQTNYAFNGKAFVYVKYAIPVAANKAWLNISNSNARVINIVFDETTGITNADRTKSTDDSWYTIDGRKVNAPTKKGVYILNGQKVVVK